MVLAIFNAAGLASQLRQLLGSGLLGSEGGHGKSDFVGFFNHFAFAHMLDVAVDANHLSYAG